mgnify:CR=1 FL=1
MESSLYFGEVRHQRKSPKKHAFRYRVFMAHLFLDVDLIALLAFDAGVDFELVVGGDFLRQISLSGRMSLYLCGYDQRYYVVRCF